MNANILMQSPHQQQRLLFTPRVHNILKPNNFFEGFDDLIHAHLWSFHCHFHLEDFLVPPSFHL